MSECLLSFFVNVFSIFFFPFLAELFMACPPTITAVAYVTVTTSFANMSGFPHYKKAHWIITRLQTVEHDTKLLQQDRQQLHSPGSGLASVRKHETPNFVKLRRCGFSCVENLLLSSSLVCVVVLTAFFLFSSPHSPLPRPTPTVNSKRSAKLKDNINLVAFRHSHTDTHTHIHTTDCTPATRTYTVLLQPERTAL